MIEKNNYCFQMVNVNLNAKIRGARKQVYLSNPYW